MRTFTRQLAPAVLAIIVFTVLTGFVYPLVVTGFAQLFWHDKANGSLIKVDGQVVGSSLIGQQFAAPQYFHPRPSAAGTGYDGLASGASNLGPTNPDLLKTVDDRVAAYRQENNLPAGTPVPVDAVTASASGLDPDISVANAKLQAARVAAARGMSVDQVLAQVQAHTNDRQWGFLGEPGVNVLELNLALDGKK
jgi:K+-transporting ATPase ATPase C chain